MKRDLPVRTDFLKKGLLVTFVISYLAFVHFRGIIFSDEGYILNAAWRMILGQVPYRDFDMVYTPTSFFAVFAVFKALGVSVFSGRVLMFLVSTVTFGLTFKIIRRFSGSLAMATLGSLVYLVWGPGQINFPWPTMFAITFGVIATFFLLKRRQTEWATVLAGFFVMVTFLSKQNLGAGLFLAEAVFLFLVFKQKLKAFLIGSAICFFVWLGYLIANGATSAFFQNLYFHTFQKIVVEGTISTALVTPSANPFLTLGKIVIYGLPGLVGLLAMLIIAKRKEWTLLPIPILGIVFYLLGIRPVTDYNHFVPLLSLSGLSLTVLSRLTRIPLVKFLIVLILLGLVSLGFYRSLWSGYYRWDEPIVSQTAYISNDRVKIWATEAYLMQVNALESEVINKTAEGDRIFVNVYLPMVYFLTSRQNGTRIDYFSDSATSAKQQEEMVMDLEKNNVNLVVGNFLNLNRKSRISEYLLQNFETVETKGNYVFLRRKP